VSAIATKRPDESAGFQKPKMRHAPADGVSDTPAVQVNRERPLYVLAFARAAVLKLPLVSATSFGFRAFSSIRSAKIAALFALM